MVVVFGSINLDLVARVPRIPAPGETLAGAGFATAPGGKGANQALAARYAGATVALFGAVGRDDFAVTALAHLKAAGVDLAGVTAVEAPTGVALIHVDDRGENAITVIAGANAQAHADQVPQELLRTGNTLLMQLESPVAEVARLAARARQAGARTVLNAAPALPLPVGLIGDIDLLVVNEREASFYADSLGLAGDSGSFFARMEEHFGVAVVLTLGARGARAMAGGELMQAEPPRIDVIDTTGAGDALVGAFAAALDRGMPVREALAEGVRAGALTCTHHGAQRPLTGNDPSERVK